MRTLNTNGAALQARRLAGERIPVVPLLYLGPNPVTGTGIAVAQRWAIDGTPRVWDSQTWAARDIVLGNLQSEVSEFSGITITLPAVTDPERALVFSDVEGSLVRIYRAWVDPDGATTGTPGAVGDALLFWEGELDQAGWQAGRESIAHFTAESLASVALRPKPSRYTNDEQQRLSPGDTSLDVDPATDAATIVWPAASFFRV